MRRAQGTKVFIVIAAILLSIWYIYPTLRLATLSSKVRGRMDSGQLAKLERRAVRLGLDLKGGMHLVLEVDKSNLSPKEAQDAVDRALEIIRNRVDQFGVSEPLIQRAGQDRMIIELPGLQDPERAKELIGRTALLEFKLVKDQKDIKALLDKIDDLLAGGRKEKEEKEEAKLKELFEESPAGSLEAEMATFEEEHPLSYLVEFQDQKNAQVIVPEEEVPLVDSLLSLPGVNALIPQDMELSWGSEYKTYREGRVKGLYLLKRNPELTGAHLTDAKVTIGGGLDPDIANRPIVNMRLDKRGARIFSRVTGANIDKLLAIILDGRVYSAPRIKSKIPDGRAIITGIGQMTEAKDLAIVLRAGALPAPVDIIEERTVGPSLGEDSIRKGINAAIIGMLLVVGFMVFYYKGAGLIADLALALNLIFVMAALAGLRAALTLPGIAGIILTIGMAVDANVLIFERIREELRAGKTVRVAIDAGYSRAFRTILDANLTTFFTALILYLVGTGPVKGFGTTLMLGIASSMFTAIVVTRVIFDSLTAGREVARLSI
jgi:SecD/SecF fusion protein